MNEIIRPSFDWKNPDYTAVWQERAKVLARLRENPSQLPLIKAYYRENPIAFVSDWGVTVDPRNADIGRPTFVPFILFPRQIEWMEWVLERWHAREPGLCEKSRDMGVSWCAIALSCSLCIFRRGMMIGFGSRKAEYVDKIGDLKALLPKARVFMSYLPPEFRAGWVEWRDSPSMRIIFPETASTIGGEAGEDIGRGDRKALYFVDEFAHFKNGELADASLSQTTNCRIDMSSVRGMNNPFARKRWGRKIDFFIFDWHAQPLDAKLLTPDGWTLMGDIKEGDSVIGIDGAPTEVLGVFPQGRKEVYKVSFNDGSSTESCADHLWEVIPAGNQRAERRHIRSVMPLREIMKDYLKIDNRGFRQHCYQIPLTAPIRGFHDVDLPLDAYVLGCLLGDGSLPANPSSAIGLSIGKPDTQIIDLVNVRLPFGCDVKQDKEIQYRISANRQYHGGAKGRGCHNPINEAIRMLGLVGTQSHDKFIPEMYKLASITSRLDLLQGLMDTDGHASKMHPGTAILTTVSKRLAEDVSFIAQTLGGVGKIKITRPNPIAVFGNRVCRRREFIYIVHVNLPDGVLPFKLDRKVQAYKPAVRHPARRSIVSIELVGEKDCQCINVAATDGLYLTDDCIVTHNSDPRKDQAWYEKQCDELDPVVVAQEIDRDYSASVEGIVIPGAWIRSCVDACQKLGIEPTGADLAALDVADEGRDKNAICGTHGIEIRDLEEWSGRGADLYQTAQRTVDFCDEHGYRGFRYDEDGLGAGIRGDMRIINEKRVSLGARVCPAEGWRGSEAVVDPEGIVEGTKGIDGKDQGRKNKDFFANRKAQGWWALRRRVQRTHRWVTEGVACDPDEIISFSSKSPNCMKAVAELSQPTYKVNEAGKMIINKKPEGSPSPNLADAIMMRFAPGDSGPLVIGQDLLQRARMMRPARRY